MDLNVRVEKNFSKVTATYIQDHADHLWKMFQTAASFVREIIIFLSFLSYSLAGLLQYQWILTSVKARNLALIAGSSELKIYFIFFFFPFISIKSYFHLWCLTLCFFSRTIQCIPYAYTKFRYLWGMYNADHTWKHLSLGHPQCQGQAGHVASELFEEIWTWLNVVYLWVWKVRAKEMQKKE